VRLVPAAKPSAAASFSATAATAIAANAALTARAITAAAAPAAPTAAATAKAAAVLGCARRSSVEYMGEPRCHRLADCRQQLGG
jgi:hypothetical protein